MAISRSGTGTRRGSRSSWLYQNGNGRSYTPERARRLDEGLNPLSEIFGNWRWETFTGKHAPEILAAAHNLAAQNPASAQRGTAVPDDLAIGPNLPLGNPRRHILIQP